MAYDVLASEPNMRNKKETETGKIKEFRKGKIKAYKKWLTKKQSEHRQHYNDNDGELRRLENAGKNEFWVQKCLQIESVIEGAHTTEAWRTMTNLRKISQIFQLIKIPEKSRTATIISICKNGNRKDPNCYS